MSGALRTRFDYDAGDVHLRYAEARRISPQAMAMWLEAIERHVPRSTLDAAREDSVRLCAGAFPLRWWRSIQAEICSASPPRPPRRGCRMSRRQPAVSRSPTAAGI